MANRSAEFPATLEIDYPDRELNRLTTFFQPFTVIPIAIILALITRATLRAGSANYLVGTVGIVFPATVLMLLFRRKYPQWWFDWNLDRKSTRLNSSHTVISYAVFCLKKKKETINLTKIGDTLRSA